MKKNSPVPLTIFGYLIILSCSGNHVHKKQIGSDIVEANFIGDKISGTANFYSLSGVLECQANFIDGKKNGMSKTFYDNGKTEDSMYYVGDLLHGYSCNFDPTGKLKMSRTNYYGIEVGDHLFYIDGRIREYSFDNFEGTQLVYCSYDSVGRCNMLKFNARAIVNNTYNEHSDSVMRVFIYFPHPNDFDIIYKMISIDKSQKRKEATIDNARLFLDTIFNIEKSNIYYLSVDYKNKSNDSTVNVLYQNLSQK